MASRSLRDRTATRNRLLVVLVMVVILIAIGVGFSLRSRIASKQRLIVSTTTSLYETMLLDILKVEFEKKYPSLNVSFISQGTGLAIETAMRGDADMIIVHDRASELKFLEEGYGVNRKVIAYNFFVIVGPAEDPAQVRGLTPADALKKISELEEEGSVIWVSRGDDSGTHAKEKQIWNATGLSVLDLRKKIWYLEAGSGMTATLKVADEKGAYTLVDQGTYLTNYFNGNTKLDIVVDAGKDTLNVYSAIANNPRKISGSKFEASMKFIRFLISDDSQSIIADFGKDKFGKALFKPYVTLLKEGSNQEMIELIQEVAYFEGKECPSPFRYIEEDLYR